MTGRLNVTLDFSGVGEGIAVGQLGWDRTQREVVAEWDADFPQAGLNVSPLLVKSYSGLLRPKARAFGELPGLFGDSLPDGWGRLLIDRTLTSRGKSRSEITDLDRLAMVGSHGMGALCYRPEDDYPIEDDLDLDWFDGLVPEIGNDVAAEDLERLRGIAGGSQGARPKFVAILDEANERLHDHRMPLEDGWRHVLAKRRAQGDVEGAVEAEAAYSDLARAAGVEMTPVAVLRASEGEPYFITDRFDRQENERLHMQTVAALLDVDFRTAQLDYIELLKVVRMMTRDYREVEQMFRRMVFNARVMNRDDHLKNHAFLMDASGEWRLAPAYDVSFSLGPGGEHTLLIAGEGRRPGREHFLEAAKKAGIKEKRAAEIVEEIDGVVRDWSGYADVRDVPSVLRKQIAEEIKIALTW
ncbi:type II toxin-antitoxin system HipA family toxin [Celeribacter sp. PS-C1]|uniref:type II toxin-antitoxin system HipA family toxin n=1 Tax=Celeribacter sp. PS-C1 TaxID=2820813 RepID=UPI001C67FEAA|nr:type II toxin-antitoxin system HipA family toxin [Celeribacter sp. PS-C1]MBW6419356.1 type II toxin-antitoxin system HipA family toxin [Celeribacter sp. PS-C1]